MVLCVKRDATGPHAVAVFSTDQLPVCYGGSMTSVQGATWVGNGDGAYRCVGADRRSQSPPYPVSRGRVNGSGPLPSPSTHSAVAAASFGVCGAPTSSVYHVDPGPSSTAVHANLALKVDTDNGL